MLIIPQVGVKQTNPRCILHLAKKCLLELCQKVTHSWGKIISNSRKVITDAAPHYSFDIWFFCFKYNQDRKLKYWLWSYINCFGWLKVTCWYLWWEESALAYVCEQKELFCCITNVLEMSESENYKVLFLSWDFVHFKLCKNGDSVPKFKFKMR